jgi:hypothetical protein
MDIFMAILIGGWNALVDYLSAHVLTCLVPAFFIAGAISVFLSQSAILKYFGPQAKKPVSYGVASVSGTILAVCSCTVLPLFGGIYKRGAGIGPAIAFLYSGPAINILAISYSAQLLGLDLGIGRAIGAILFSVLIGLLMAYIYRREAAVKDATAFAQLEGDTGLKPWWQQLTFFAVLVGILITASAQQWIGLGVLMAGLGVILWRWFNGAEIKLWMKETLHFVRLVLPWLIVGVFAAGIIKTFVPAWAITDYVGGNTLLGNFIASFLGALMYFATLTEVPIIKAFLDLGMGKGPALALLLAGPALSLPSMLVLRNIMGTKKMLTYVGLVVVFATLTGYIFGFFFK